MAKKRKKHGGPVYKVVCKGKVVGPRHKKKRAAKRARKALGRKGCRVVKC